MRLRLTEIGKIENRETCVPFDLGKAYQEKRIDKRERRQPQIIPDLPYLNWEKTGQAPAGPYAVCEDLIPVINSKRYGKEPTYNETSL